MELCLPERGIRNNGVFAMKVEKLWSCVWIVYPVRLEELGESRGLVWVLGERCIGRGHDADNKRNCGSTRFWGKRSGGHMTREQKNGRVGGEEMIRGGVERMRWRARARRGTMAGGGASTGMDGRFKAIPKVFFTDVLGILRPANLFHFTHVYAYISAHPPSVSSPPPINASPNTITLAPSRIPSPRYSCPSPVFRNQL